MRVAVTPWPIGYMNNVVFSGRGTTLTGDESLPGIGGDPKLSGAAKEC